MFLISLNSPERSSSIEGSLLIAGSAMPFALQLAETSTTVTFPSAIPEATLAEIIVGSKKLQVVIVKIEFPTPAVPTIEGSLTLTPNDTYILRLNLAIDGGRLQFQIMDTAMETLYTSIDPVPFSAGQSTVVVEVPSSNILKSHSSGGGGGRFSSKTVIGTVYVLSKGSRIDLFEVSSDGRQNI